MNMYVFWFILRLIILDVCGFYAAGATYVLVIQCIPTFRKKELSSKTKNLLLLSAFVAMAICFAIGFSFYHN